eukprot:7458202-Alexandrium_andersonii.AAC.1
MAQEARHPPLQAWSALHDLPANAQSSTLGPRHTAASRQTHAHAKQDTRVKCMRYPPWLH